MKVTFKELEFFVLTHEFSDDPIELNEATIINNQRTFAESHLEVLKDNSGNVRVMPFYLRLKQFYKLIKTKKS